MNTKTLRTVEINGETISVNNCPFCGGEAELKMKEYNDCWGMGMFVHTSSIRIVCSKCGCGTIEYSTTENTKEVIERLCSKALEVWNSRV